MAEMAGFSQYPEDGYVDVVADVMREWTLARERAIGVGMPAADILFDPGLGFAKSAHQSLELLRRTAEFAALGTPIVVGPSRKSFLDAAERCAPERRLGATIAASLFAASEGAMLLRVHDVGVVRQALTTQRTLSKAQPNSQTSDARREGSCSKAC
jgi:dihydropteroate synthase